MKPNLNIGGPGSRGYELRKHRAEERRREEELEQNSADNMEMICPKCKTNEWRVNRGINWIAYTCVQCGYGESNMWTVAL